MTQTITATEAKNRLGEWIKHVYRTNEVVIVEKAGFPVVAIVSMAQYLKYQQKDKAAKPLAQSGQIHRPPIKLKRRKTSGNDS